MDKSQYLTGSEKQPAVSPTPAGYVKPLSFYHLAGNVSMLQPDVLAMHVIRRRLEQQTFTVAWEKLASGSF